MTEIVVKIGTWFLDAYKNPYQCDRDFKRIETINFYASNATIRGAITVKNMLPNAYVGV